MCRWLAYVGPPVYLDVLLLEPSHSLLDQSLQAKLAHHTTNGDGFGIGWYGARKRPGIYRDILPAWNDENFRNLAEQTRSGLFLAHIRASTGTPLQRTNCHPFGYENWLFQHNGLIPELERVRRALVLEIAPELFPRVQGSTDSELMFYLALSLGLQHQPKAALERMIARVEAIRTEAGVAEAIHCSAAVSDGHYLYALRYSSDSQSPSLFYTTDLEVLREYDESLGVVPPGTVVVVSEPLGKVAQWKEIPESTLMVAGDGQVRPQPFEPGQPQLVA